MQRNHTRLRRLAPGLALFVALAAGCGGGGGGSATATAAATDTKRATSELPDACSLITNEEVANVLGQHSVDDGDFKATSKAENVGKQSSACTYSWTSQRGHDQFSVSVFPARSFVDDPGMGEHEPIDGIGDKAFSAGGNYYAQVGDLMVHIVDVQEGEGSDEDLLRIAAGRLP